MNGLLTKKDRWVLEIMLIVVALGMAFLLFQMGGYKMVVLNLFYLPIVLSGYFLGRTSSGTLALLSVLAVTIVATQSVSGLAAHNTPVMLGLAIAVWGGSLGLTAILVGTLCDERSKTVDELHAAYVGVVEVLSQYLQSANPNEKSRSIRVAELCQGVAEEMRLPRRQIDDIRVGALLHDIGNVEITTQLLSRAVDTLEANPGKVNRYTFSGMDLVQSLGTVLNGAVPLLLSQDDEVGESADGRSAPGAMPAPVGAKIIRAARAYDTLVADVTKKIAPLAAIQELRKDIASGFDPEVLDALEQQAQKRLKAETAEPAFA